MIDPHLMAPDEREYARQKAAESMGESPLAELLHEALNDIEYLHTQIDAGALDEAHQKIDVMRKSLEAKERHLEQSNELIESLTRKLSSLSTSCLGISDDAVERAAIQMCANERYADIWAVLDESERDELRGDACRVLTVALDPKSDDES